MTVWEFLLAAGIPSAITGILVWYFKRYVERKEQERIKHEKNIESFMTYLVKTSRATYVVAEATAKAVQRIPDAHCNGDMKSALEKATKIHNDEKDYLICEAVRHVFED